MKEQVYEDWSLVAFFSLPEISKKYSLKIIPFKLSNGRVAWQVTGNTLDALNEIYKNKKVPINDYIKSLRAVRHCIYTLRSLPDGG